MRRKCSQISNIQNLSLDNWGKVDSIAKLLFSIDVKYIFAFLPTSFIMRFIGILKYQ